MKKSTLTTICFTGALLAAVFWGSVPQAQAAACCGGGLVAPQIVGSDYRAQVSATLGSEALTLNTAWAIPQILDDRIQLSAQFPIAYGMPAAGRNFSMGIGDIQLGLGVEILRNWEYSQIKPDLVSFVAVRAPTGLSVYELKNASQLIGGSGFFRVSSGVFLTKAWEVPGGDLDAVVLTEVHRSIARSFIDGSGDSLLVDPGFGAGIAMGLGFNPKALPLRVGFQVLPSWDQGVVSVQPGNAGRTNDRLSLDLGVNAAWMVDPTVSLVLNYLEPIGGSPTQRTVALLLQKRWWR